MKKSRKFLNGKTITQVLGIGLGIAAIYFALKNVQGEKVAESLRSMNPLWLIPIILINFGVVALKALRWQIIIRPVKHIGFLLMYRILFIGLMANNVLPARLGEPLRIHMLGKEASISRVTMTATLIADRIAEGLSFLMLAAVLTYFTAVPEWMRLGLIITLIVTLAVYLIAVIYSTRKIKNKFLKQLQDGVKALTHLKLTFLSLAISLASWFLQGVLIYMLQLAFGVHLPFWGIVLVLLALNLAVALPSAPAYIGTFELACVLSYTFLGIDKSLGLLLGVTLHLLLVVPVTLVGGLLMLMHHISPRRIRLSEDLDALR